jgi:hypothetical protein
LGTLFCRLDVGGYGLLGCRLGNSIECTVSVKVLRHVPTTRTVSKHCIRGVVHTFGEKDHVRDLLVCSLIVVRHPVGAGEAVHQINSRQPCRMPQSCNDAAVPVNAGKTRYVFFQCERFLTRSELAYILVKSYVGVNDHTSTPKSRCRRTRSGMRKWITVRRCRAEDMSGTP